MDFNGLLKDLVRNSIDFTGFGKELKWFIEGFPEDLAGFQMTFYWE